MAIARALNMAKRVNWGRDQRKGRPKGDGPNGGALNALWIFTNLRFLKREKTPKRHVLACNGVSVNAIP